MTDTPDLLRGSLKLYIMLRLNRTPTKEELDKLAEEWLKTPHMSLSEFMSGKK